MLAAQLTEVEDDRKHIRDTVAFGAEVRGLAERVVGSLTTMSTLLEHIGAIVEPQASASGNTPLMSPCNGTKRPHGTRPPSGRPSAPWGGVWGGARPRARSAFLHVARTCGGKRVQKSREARMRES